MKEDFQVVKINASSGWRSTVLIQAIYSFSETLNNVKNQRQEKLYSITVG